MTENTENKLESNRFQEGYDPRRNLDGRPKGAKNFTTKVREALLKVADDKGTTHEKLLVKKILELAGNGDQKMIQLIWNYLDGKPTQKIEASFENREVEETLEIIKQAIDGPKKTSTNIPSGGQAPDNNSDTGEDNGGDPIQETPESSGDTSDSIRKESNSSPIIST